MHKRSIGKKILRIAAGVLAALVLAAGLGIGWLTFREYRPKDIEELPVAKEAKNQIQAGQELTIMSWNIGYGALGEEADFFMDGGKSVKTADAAGVRDNLNGILNVIEREEPDMVLLQEVDRDSKRTDHIDEASCINERLSGDSTFASNFLADYVPYPIPTIGKVDSGIMTVSSYSIDEASRIQLPVPFQWPVRTVNIKRCLSVNRLPVAGTDKEFVLVNLHLEAYDKGEGKKAQTEMLRTILEEEAAKGNYVVAGGDFNQSFSDIDLTDYPIQEGMWKPSVIDLEAFDDSLQFVMDPDTPSCRSLDKAIVGADRESFQYYIIDGFIVSKNIVIEDFSVLDEQFRYSDHNPLRMTIRLK